jgi:DNA invertase Pin-like site-specific DNA recombinase
MNVGYVRLSRDEDKENYTSIESQLSIIKDYAVKHNIILDEIFIDDNYSGYTFNRPEFKRMRTLLDDGKISLILAKDLSRIGRHNAKVLLFIDEIKEMNKQLILIDEGSSGYDTNKDDDDIIGIKTWYNERYIKDVSHKIKSSFRAKQKNGDLIFHEFYGYKKDPHDKSKLNIDDNITNVIKLIFQMYLAGSGYRVIAQALNDRNIPTPSVYLKQNIESKGKVFKNKTNSNWETYMISRILKNDVYVGTLRCAKTYKRTIKGKAIKNTDENQYVFPNHHPAIISQEDFELAQTMMVKRNSSNFRGVKKYEYKFSGYLKCADCHSYMIGRLLKSCNNMVRGYDCSNFQKHGKTACKYHGISEKDLLEKYIAHLKEERKNLCDYLDSLKTKKEKENNEIQLENFNKQLAIAKNEYKVTLSQKIKDIANPQNTDKKMVEESYADIEKEKLNKIAYYTKQINEIQETIETNSSKAVISLIKVFDKIIEKGDVTKKDLLYILNEIEITK